MNFFKTVFSADSDPEQEDHEQDQEEGEEEERESPPSQNPIPNPNSPSFQIGSTWNLGGLMKTIQSKSESVIQTYRKDLEEFSTGLKNETSVFKEVAKKAVLDLPGSLEAGASVAQESLESVGQALDEFGGSVRQIISQGKEAILAIENDSNEEDSNSNAYMNPNSLEKRYSRFEMQVMGIQNDENTYVDEVESEKEYGEWIKEFELDEKEEEIEGLMYENEKLEGFYEKLVPGVIDRETFWRRYFYRVWRLKMAEDARAKLVKRVIAGEEEEELTWSDDDDSEKENEENKEESAGEALKSHEESKVVEEAKLEEIVERSKSLEDVEDEKHVQQSRPENVDVEEVKHSQGDDLALNKEEKSPLESKIEEKVPVEAKLEERIPVVESNTGEKTLVAEPRVEEKVPVEPQSDHGESGKDSDFSMVSTQPSVQGEEDIDWDEMEDIGENEDKKVDRSNLSTKQVDLRKRLSVAEDDEDLTWDIEEEDDEPAKS